MANPYEMFGDWVEAIKKSCTQSSNWTVLDGEWCYSNLSDIGAVQKLYHLCDGSHKQYLKQPNTMDDNQITYMHHTECVSCGADVPEGVKVIVMLLESNI